jgi:hypothetical protein
MGVFYRLGQFWHNVTAKPLSKVDQKEIADHLNPQELNLFRQMTLSDQQHAYRVYCSLRDNGYRDNDLLTAALLHDVGKSKVYLSVWDRSLAVLGEAFLPLKVKEWGEGEANDWKRTFSVREKHAIWGGAMAEEAGSSREVVDLIIRHQDLLPAGVQGKDERLALLQWADGRN